MAFPTTGLLDDFNRADADPINTDWDGPIFTSDPECDLDNNAITNSLNNFCESFWNTSFGVNQEAHVTLLRKGGNNDICNLFIKIDTVVPNDDHYQVKIIVKGGADQWQARKNVGGTETQIGSTQNQEIAVNDLLGLEYKDSAGTLHMHINTGGGWTEVFNEADTSHQGASGFIGVGFFDSGRQWRFDDFGGGDTVIPAYTPYPVARRTLRNSINVR